MAQIKARNIDDWVVDVLKDKATRSGCSLEQYLRHLLKEAALDDQLQFAKEQMAFLGRSAEKFGTLPDSTEGIREDRMLNG